METINPVLRVDRLEKVFTTRSWFTHKIKKEFVAVNKISFELKKGEILGLLGPNGAGKTTTIQMLLGTLTPTGGSITYLGKDFATHRSEVLQHVGFASAYSKLPGKLTVYENLDVFARLYGLSSTERKQRIERLLEIFSITDLQNKLTRNLSAGQTTRAILAKAFLPNPQIVLLDEPTASLDPDIAHDIRQFILQQQRERNISIVFTSHNMDEVAEVCDRVVVMKHGTIVAADTPAHLAASISVTRVELIISEGLDAALAYLNKQIVIYAIEKNSIKIEIEEHKVSDLLAALAHVGVHYSQISINKPTLEDYFIRLAKQ
ncbi:MAG TPA: ABC transporter ATP-binding protein [Candidatus Dependentiae bacterium]|nr:ABC transporter ATP-binding protein [Candidatus Dependentiae bacterium]